MIKFTDESMEMMQHCAASNPSYYNMNKALEECVEFQEVLIKLQTKHSSNPKRPDAGEAIKEYGDVIYRGLISLKTIFEDKELPEILEMVSAHINKKLTRLGTFRTAGTYQKGL